jgi:hypothetical protein
MISCVHKMCERTYGQTNMKRAITLAKINHPWNRYVCSHILCTQLVIFLLSHFIHIWYLGWPWSEHAHIIPISRQMISCVQKMCERTYGQTNMKRAITLAKINHTWNLYNMRIIAQIMANRYQIWIKCDKRQMTSCVDWPWSEHAYIIPISRMVNFCESYSPFHVCLTICPSIHLVYATSHLSFVTFYWYLVSWSKDKWLVAYTRCANRHMVKQTWKGL